MYDMASGERLKTGEGKMNCIKCNAPLKDGAMFCDACGAPQQPQGAPQQQYAQPQQGFPQQQYAQPQMPGSVPVPPPGLPPRKLVTYRMLAFFLGTVGVHDFYAGYTVRGVCKLVLFFLGGLSGIWALVDIFTVTHDVYGRPMEDTVPKNLLTYRLLACFLGFTGAHNFYAGHLVMGLIKLFLPGINLLWALIEMCVVKKDANGNPMVMGPNAQKVGKILAISALAAAVIALAIPIATLLFSQHYYIGREVVIAGVAVLLGVAAAICGKRSGLIGVALSILVVAGVISFDRQIREIHCSLHPFIVDDDTIYLYRGNDEHVVVPDGVKIIGREAFDSSRRFYYNPSGVVVRSVTLPPSVTTIEEKAFAGCVIEKVDMPGVTTIGKEAFARCCRLMSVTIPSSVKTIGEGAFQGSALTSVTIQDGVTTIGKKAFAGCEYLKSVTIPSSVKTIEEEAFSECRKLKIVTISEGVETIGKKAFSNCWVLERVEIPSSMKTIGDEAFSWCSKLKNVKVPAGTKVGHDAFIRASW